MKTGMTVDIHSLNTALDMIGFSGDDLLQVEGAGAYVLINGERLRVPKDTHATENSIKSHIIEATEDRVVNEVGPETNYSIWIEFGVQSRPNYPAQPFIRPTVAEDGSMILNAMSYAFGETVKSRWPR